MPIESTFSIAIFEVMRLRLPMHSPLHGSLEAEMKLRPLLSVFSFVVILGGAVAVLVPTGMLYLFGVVLPNDATIALLRVFGSMEIGVGVMAWAARESGASQARDAMVVGLATLCGLAALTILLGTLGGGFNVFGWAPAVAYGAFAALFLASTPRAQGRGAHSAA
jgi:hypothetical protein